MAPATSFSPLRKSNFQATRASSSSTAPVAVLAPHASIDEDASLLDDILNFEHPEHVIPPINYDGIENLVIVCCHAIFHPDINDPSFPLRSPHQETNWYLADFQRSNDETGKIGEHETFIAHINAGLNVLRIGPWRDNSIVVFSGGATKAHLTPLSEARSYYHAALAAALAAGQYSGGFPHVLFAKGRILLEEHATDSFQNLLFSILLYRQTTGRYPKQVRIITHAFKSRRFLTLHAKVIRWPSDKAQLQGINPPMSTGEYEDTVKGEETRGYAPWEDDPLGLGEMLSTKRMQRGWRTEYIESIGEGLEDSVKSLLQGQVEDDLPWTDEAACDTCR